MLVRLGCWILLVAAVALAAPPDKPPVILRVGKVETPALRAGDSASVTIPLTIARGYHVNANPAAGEDYIPLEIVLADSAGLQVGKIVYPASKLWRLEGGMEDLKVYEGTFDVRLPLRADPDARAGVHALKGAIEFQACDDQVCLMPDSRPLTLVVRVLPAAESRAR